MRRSGGRAGDLPPEAQPNARARREEGGARGRARAPFRRPRSTRRCSTEGATSAASGGFTGCSSGTKRSASCEIPLRHPKYAAPELLATKPNQLELGHLGLTKWTYFYLYVVIDKFSRYVVGWLVADAESSELAEKFISEACVRQGNKPKSENGSVTTRTLRA